jgi:hypothetical protein
MEIGGSGFAGAPGGGFEYVEHSDEKASSQLNLANLILVNLVILIKNSAVIESKLKYGGCPPYLFTTFFTSFRELFDLTSHLISPKVDAEISTWFERLDVKDGKNLNRDIKNGIQLSRKLKMEIVKLGMLKIFEDPITPPFMVDSMLEEMVTEQTKKDIPTVIKKQIPISPPTKKKVI